MNIIRPIASLKMTALRRQPGYLEECLRVGKVTGEGQAQLVEFTPEQFQDIRRRFQISNFKSQIPKPGLGDRVHAVAGPIGRALHWPCLKGDGTTDLKPGSPCDKIRTQLNRL
jgi:hypothetical protein